MTKKRRPAAPASRVQPANASRRRWTWVAAVIALLLVAGAAAAWGTYSRSANAPARVAVLADIPWPDTAALDATAQAAFTQQRELVTGLLAASPRNDPALGAAFGRLAQLYLAYEKIPAASAALANAAALLPEDHRWPYYQAYLALLDKQPVETAIASYRAALALKPDDAPTLIHLAEIYRDQQRPDEVRALLDKVLAADPNSAPAHYILGQIAFEAKDLKTAVAEWEKTLQLQPEASLVRGQLAIAYRDLGDSARSTELLAKRGDAQVVLNDPLVAELQGLQSAVGAYLTRGGAQMKAGHFAEAADLFASAATAEPKNVLASLNLGAALINAGKPAEAKQALQVAAELDPTNSQVQYNLGRLAEQAEQFDEARAAYEKAITADPKNAEAQLGLATLQRKSGDCAAAVPHFQVYLQDNPTDVKARRLAILCLAQLNAFADAATVAEAGHQIDPKDPVLADLLLRLLAAAPDDTVRDGPRAVRMAEAMVQDGTLANKELLAMAYAEVGRYDEAASIQEPLLKAYALDAKHLNWVPFLALNLNFYQKRQPSRFPFPDFAYTDTAPAATPTATAP